MSGSLSKATEEDQRAFFDELCAKHLAALRAAARHFCRDQALAGDLIQDTLERAWTKLATLENEAHARAWLVRILRNTWLDHLRRRKPEVALEEAAEPAVDVEEPLHWERLTIEDVRRAIESLGEPFRTVAILHDIDGLSYEEISKRLRVPYATAATRLHRARRMIRAALQQQLGGEPS